MLSIPKRKPVAPEWAARFKLACRAKGLNLAKVAERMGKTEPTVRSWTNGTRKINLEDFFLMCATADIDAEAVLFGDRMARDDVSKWALKLAAKLDAMRSTKSGEAALVVIERAFAAEPVPDAAVERAYKTNERPKIRGVISRPSLFNDDFSGPR